MKKILLFFLFLVLAACTAIPATEPGVPVTGDATPTSPVGHPETGTVEANGITIAYESFGSQQDETILLIGGTGQQLVDWPIEFVNALVERGYRVVRFDNRDIGLSTKISDAGIPDVAAVGKALQEGQTPPIPYTIRDMSKDTVGLLDSLGIERAHLVGASMGGAIAQWVAIDHPERVLSLTTIAADSGNPEIPAIAKPEAFAGVPPQPTTADREAFIDWQVKTFQVLAGSTYPVEEATLREWAERDFERGFDAAGLVRQQTAILVDHVSPTAERLNNLNKIEAHTVIVQGTEDPLVPMASAEDLAERIPNAELRVIPGLGHFIPTALVPEITEAVMAAVDGDTQPPAAENDLVGSIWQLISFGPVGATNPVIGNAPITLEFELDGQAGGQGGCNSYGGPYRVQNDSLNFEEITSTLIACSDQAVSEQEQQYLLALQTASRFIIDGDKLTIWYQDEGATLNFERSTLSTAEPPGGTPPAQGAERIRFPEGDTSVEIFADVPGRGSDLYVLAAEEGQIMSVEITSPHNDVLLEIVGEDGTPLKRYQNGPPSWTSTLPATQDYFIRAVSVGETTSYTLRIWVEPAASSARERVEFEPDATSANRSGSLSEGGVKEYVLFAAAGQNMHIQTVGYNAPVEFTLASPSGETWSGQPQPAGAYIFTVQVTLPQDGDYVVRLSVPPGEGATRYDIAFTITNTSDPLPTVPSPGEPPERITFEPGTDTAQRIGLLPSGSAVKQYVLSANAGQTMTVDVTSDDVALSLTITTPSGMQRIPEAFPADGGGYRVGHEFTLPESGDYLLTLTKADHTPSTNYTADFTIK
jgi:pimeloyl-ACP methyl ester carboxylesterase